MNTKFSHGLRGRSTSNAIRRIAIALLTLLTALPSVPATVAFGQSSQSTLLRTFNTIWGDPPFGSLLSHQQLFFLTTDAGQHSLWLGTTVAVSVNLSTAPATVDSNSYHGPVVLHINPQGG